MWARVGRAGLAGLLVMAAASCSESDPSLFADIGVTRLLLVDPGLARPVAEDPTAYLQVAEWQVTRADLLIGTTLDLLNGEACKFTDTVLVTSAPGVRDACKDGLVIESSADPVQAWLVLDLSDVRVRRAVPVLLRPGGDFDGDGIPDDGNGSGGAFDAPCGKGGVLFGCDDNCPFVANPDQADKEADGIGTACSIPGTSARDSDGDLVADASDNCVFVPNPSQADTTGVAADGIPDAIGDACSEQVADVRVAGQAVIHLELGPIDLVQPSDQVTLLTVDFNSVRALQCDWNSQTCELDPAEVRFCRQTSASSAGVLGCPAR